MPEHYKTLTQVYKISPESGSVFGGTVVTIQGAGFGTDASLLSVSLGQVGSY